MNEKGHKYGLSEDKQHNLRAINRLAIGSIIVMWGSLLALRQAGIIEKNVSTLPFVFIAFGILLVAGGIYRLYARERIALTQSTPKNATE